MNKKQISIEENWVLILLTTLRPIFIQQSFLK